MRCCCPRDHMHRIVPSTRPPADRPTIRELVETGMAGGLAGGDGGGVPVSTLPPRPPPPAYRAEDSMQAWRRVSRQQIVPFECRGGDGKERPAEGSQRSRNAAVRHAGKASGCPMWESRGGDQEKEGTGSGRGGAQRKAREHEKRGE